MGFLTDAIFPSGEWYVESILDKRWNGSGYSCMVGGFCIPDEAKKHIEKMKLIYGEPPKDLCYGYMKD